MIIPTDITLPSDGYIYHADIPQEMATINGTRTEQCTTTEFTAHVEYLCPWSDRYVYIHYLMDTVYNVSIYNTDVPELAPSGWPAAMSPNYFSYYYPAQVQSIGVSLFGPDSASNATSAVSGSLPFQEHSLAKLSVEYKGLSRPGSSSLDEQVSPTLGMRQLPAWGYYWRSDSSPVLDNEAPSVQEVQVKINRTLGGIRRIPDWFYTLAGCVNSLAWQDALTRVTYMPGTLLFIPTNTQRQVTFARGDDDAIWNIAFELNWNPIGWNNVQRPNGVDSMMMYNASENEYQMVIHYPAKPFPTMVIDPNIPDCEQLYGDPYYVHLQREDGSTYLIYVDIFGNVSFPNIV